MNEQNLTPYVFEDELVRVRQDENGNAWFVAKDVCNVLRLENNRQAVGRLEDDERMTVTTNDGHSGKRGGARMMTLVNESGLYTLIFTSRKPEAKTFRKWVTSEVLPSIRKTGRYEVPKPEARPTREFSEQEMEGHLEALKELAQSVPLRASHRVQMMHLATRMARAEGAVREVDVLTRYLTLCETVTTRKVAGIDEVEDEQIRQFVRECCAEGDDSCSTKFSDLYRAYASWCKRNGYSARSVNWFGNQISKRFKRYKSGVSRYRGARLLN